MYLRGILPLTQSWYTTTITAGFETMLNLDLILSPMIYRRIITHALNATHKRYCQYESKGEKSFREIIKTVLVLLRSIVHAIITFTDGVEYIAVLLQKERLANEGE
jgi:hypothetical protein